MSLLNKLASMIETRIIKFVNFCTLVNRDIPLHDYKAFEDGDEPTKHVVGSSNMANASDQKKLFTSKSTLLFATGECTVRFNNANNVAVTILANTWYEFYQNVHTLIVDAIASQAVLHCYFEGTLPEECRIGA